MRPYTLYPCYYCHQHAQLNEMSRYDDGRLLCKECIKHIIVTTENLNIVAQWTLKQIEELGFKFKRGSTQVALLSKDRMKGLGQGEAEGFAQNTTSIDMRQRATHMQAEIKVMYGIPTANLVWVLAHEIAHVLVSQHQFHFNQLAEEEGFCQLVALLVSERSKNPQMPKIITKEWKNPDPVYGGELRKAYQCYQQQGFQHYFRHYL